MSANTATMPSHSERKYRWCLNDLEDLRERRDELLLAVEQTSALLHVEEMEPEPDLDWMRRARSFMLQGKAILYRLEQHDKDERRKAHNESLRLSEKKEASKQSALGQAKAANQKLKEANEELKAVRKQLALAKNQLTNTERSLEAQKRKNLRIQATVDRNRDELKALRDHLGHEAFMSVVETLRHENAEEVCQP